MFQARTLWKAISNGKHWLWSAFGETSHINIYFGKSGLETFTFGSHWNFEIKIYKWIKDLIVYFNWMIFFFGLKYELTVYFKFIWPCNC